MLIVNIFFLVRIPERERWQYTKISTGKEGSVFQRRLASFMWLLYSFSVEYASTVRFFVKQLLLYLKTLGYWSYLLLVVRSLTEVIVWLYILGPFQSRMNGSPTPGGKGIMWLLIPQVIIVFVISRVCILAQSSFQSLNWLLIFFSWFVSYVSFSWTIFHFQGEKEDKAANGGKTSGSQDLKIDRGISLLSSSLMCFLFPVIFCKSYINLYLYVVSHCDLAV